MAINGDKYINPFTDFGFKKLFGTEVNKDLLMDFLNELIHSEGKIKEVKYLNPEQLGRSEDDRRAVFDIYCETETGETFIVEMQKAKLNFFKDRSVYYASFPIREQGLRGDWDYRLKSVYTVGILNFTFNESKDEKDYYHSEVKLMDVRIFKKMFQVAEIAKLNKQEILEYEDNLKRYRDLYSAFETAKMEGEARGEIRGEKRGRIEGKIEGKIEVALKLLNKGMPVEDVCDATGLSKEQLKELIKIP